MKESLQIFPIDYDVNTEASCNILPLYKAKTQVGENIQLGPSTVHLRGHNDRPVKNHGSCIVFLYHVYKCKDKNVRT